MVFLAQPSLIPEGDNNIPQTVGHAATNVAHHAVCLICQSVLLAHSQPGIHCNSHVLFRNAATRSIPFPHLCYFIGIFCPERRALQFSSLKFLRFMLTQSLSLSKSVWTETLPFVVEAFPLKPHVQSCWGCPVSTSRSRMKVLDSMGPSTGPKGSLLVISHQLDTEHCTGTPLFTAQQSSNFTIQFYRNLRSYESSAFCMIGTQIINIFRYCHIHPPEFCKWSRPLRSFSQLWHLMFTMEVKKDSFSNKHHYFYTINSNSLLLFIKDLGQKDMDFIFLSTCSMSKIFCMLIK